MAESTLEVPVPAAAVAQARRHVKVLKLQILKPVSGESWTELGALLRDARYRTFRLANLIVSEAYLNFHLFRTGKTEEFKTRNSNALNRELRAMLAEEGVSEEALNRFSRTGAVPDVICGALSHYKTRGLIGKAKWQQVVRGNASLPVFRNDMAIPVRCDKANMRRLEKTESGELELDLAVCQKPYPRLCLATGKANDGQRVILERLLANTAQSPTGYRQRCFEIKQDRNAPHWWLFVTYDLPAIETPLRDDVVVGVDIGYACPIFAAINNGHARLGWRQFAGVAARVKSLQSQTMARRRQMLQGGKSSLVADTSRAGHGRRRRLRPIECLEGRINNAYTTLNHQLSKSIVEFALQYGARTIQIEKLDGLQEKLSGTFLGQRWRYHQLQQFIKYKADESGIAVREVNAKFTSQRCSKCGQINREFNREFRDSNRCNGFTARFQCPACEFVADADYNAARNLATVDIEAKIRQQCQAQNIAL